MRAPLAACLALLLAGCAAPTAPAPPTSTTLGCPDLPDGSPGDCEKNLLRTKDILAAAPTPETGWLCTLRHRNDNGLGVFDFYVHQDGRLAIAWDLTIQRTGGFMVIHTSVYQPQGTQALVVAYQPKGFTVLSEKKRGDPAEVHMLARQVQLDEKIDGQWHPVAVRPLIDSYQGDAWYTLAFDGPRGTEYVSPMVPGDPPRKFEPDDKSVEADGRELFVDVWLAGAKFSNANLAWPSTGNTRCNL